MFNFVEKKSFFYFSALASIVLSICPIFVVTTNYITAFVNILAIIMLFAMMILYDNNHKEIMKVLLTSFFTILIFCTMDYFFQIFYTLKDRLIGAGFQYDSIRHTISMVCQSIISVIVPILFINHFILNYNNKNHEIVININKFLLVVMTLATIMHLISVFVASNKAGILTRLGTYAVFGTVCSLLLRCMTVVSVEAFIDSRRAEKVATGNKASKNNKKKKSKKSKKSK